MPCVFDSFIISGIVTDRLPITVNVDIFACINVHESMKMENFACIKIRVLSITGSLGYFKSNFQGVHSFVDI